MPQVSVTINGRQFRMACENGEEARALVHRRLRLTGQEGRREAAEKQREGDGGDQRRHQFG